MKYTILGVLRTRKQKAHGTRVLLVPKGKATRFEGIFRR